MPSNSYLAFAFGSQLEHCDMLVFEAHADEAQVSDCHYDVDN